jgi:hypothetical protein
VFASQDRISSRPTNCSLHSLLCDPGTFPRYRKVASIMHPARLVVYRRGFQ